MPEGWKRAGTVALLASSVTGGAALIGGFGFSEFWGKSKEFWDDHLAFSEDNFCNGATNGAVIRRYGRRPDMMQAREDFCRFIWDDMLEAMDE